MCTTLTKGSDGEICWAITTESIITFRHHRVYGEVASNLKLAPGGLIGRIEIQLGRYLPLILHTLKESKMLKNVSICSDQVAAIGNLTNKICRGGFELKAGIVSDA